VISGNLIMSNDDLALVRGSGNVLRDLGHPSPACDGGLLLKQLGVLPDA